MTMKLLETVTVGSGGTASITFSNIPQQGYTDLFVVLSARTASTLVNDYLTIRFNANATGYTVRGLFGSGSSAGTFSSPGNYLAETVGNGSTANTFSVSSVYIPNYLSSANKSYSAEGVGENNGTTAFQSIVAGLWSNTAAITSITFGNSSSTNFVQHSTASLYGITAGSDGIVSVS